MSAWALLMPKQQARIAIAIRIIFVTFRFPTSMIPSVGATSAHAKAAVRAWQ